MMISETTYAVIAIALSWAAFVPYVWSIIRGHTRPHLFSWIIWTLLPAIAFVAQVGEGGGIGSIVVGCAALQSLCIVGFAVLKGERQIARSDVITFVAALAVIPVWYMTANAMLAVMLITLIDTLGFYPTFRKSWSKPDQEYLPTYAIVALSFLVSIFALEDLNVTTVFYPACLTLANGGFVALVAWRRRVIYTSRQPG